MANQNPNDQTPKLFGPQFESISLSSIGVHLLFGEIDLNTSYDTVEFLLKANMLLEDGFPLTMMINSAGGNVIDGWAIIDVMEMSRLPVSTVAIGEIGSMGVLIFSAGTKGLRVLTPSAMIMAHQFSSETWGKMHELVAARSMHDKLDNQFVQHFLKHSTMNEKQIRDILMGPSDRYLTPEECIKYGLADQIRGVWDWPTKPVIQPAQRKRKIKIA